MRIFKALTVMASADQTFNLVCSGILNIDTFDSNINTYYLSYALKKAMILKYSREEYLEVMKKLVNPHLSLDELSTIINDLIPYMDKEFKSLWQMIRDYNYKVQKNNRGSLNLIYMLFIGYGKTNKDVSYNNWLKDEDSYNTLKSNLLKANISFKMADAYELERYFHKKYDVILLSNILDYYYRYVGNNWTFEDLRKYEEQLKGLVNDEGIIFLEYMILLATRNYFPNYLIKSSLVKSSDLLEEELHYLPTPSNLNALDGVILKRQR